MSSSNLRRPAASDISFRKLIRILKASEECITGLYVSYLKIKILIMVYFYNLCLCVRLFSAGGEVRIFTLVMGFEWLFEAYQIKSYVCNELSYDRVFLLSIAFTTVLHKQRS